MAVSSAAAKPYGYCLLKHYIVKMLILQWVRINPNFPKNALFWRELRGELGENKYIWQYTDSSLPTNNEFEVFIVNEEIINWDLVPEEINKDQLYRICHISKSTALFLLRSGKIPCVYTGGKTRCYKIKKTDVKAYLEDRVVFPEAYSAPMGWYSSGHRLPTIKKSMPEVVREDMHEYYAFLLKAYPDVVLAKDIVMLTGYSKTAVNNWCAKGLMKAFRKNCIYHIPKVFLMDFFCSQYFRTIIRKTDWHIRVLKRFSKWKKQNKSLF